MPCYVDDMQEPFGNMIMCHLWADTDDELLAMVDKIGVGRKWIQGHPTLSLEKYRDASWVHFDIALSKRSLAVKAGAIQTDRLGPALHTSNLRLNHARTTGNKQVEERELAKIAQIEARRERGRRDSATPTLF
jgi:hypothetical protein